MQPDQSSVWFTDNLRKIKQLDFSNATIVTYAELSFEIYDLTFHPDSSTLYLSFTNGLGYMADGNLTILMSGDGHIDGRFELVSFGQQLPSIEFITPKLILVADYSNNVYRIIDFTYNTTSTICLASPQIRTGSVDDCRLSEPTGSLLLAQEKKILVTSHGFMGTIFYRYVSTGKR